MDPPLRRIHFYKKLGEKMLNNEYELEKINNCINDLLMPTDQYILLSMETKHQDYLLQMEIINKRLDELEKK